MQVDRQDHARSVQEGGEVTGDPRVVGLGLAVDVDDLAAGQAEVLRRMREMHERLDLEDTRKSL